jgi:ubiquinone biosynthesis protein
MKNLMLRRKRLNAFKSAARLKTIVSVFAKHGFQDLAERTKLSKFATVTATAEKTLEKIAGAGGNQKYSIAERLRMSFEELGPTFVKLGQLLATRPDLIPIDFTEEFKKLHDQVSGVEWKGIEAVLYDHFGKDWHGVFASFDQNALAAASIAQVHRATLRSGEKVVVKVQRPGIEPIIEEDLGILYQLAELLEKYIPETSPFNPVGIVDEFARSTELETNFIIEANNIRRFQENFASEPNIKIPNVYSALSGRRVLVLEQLEGIPLSHKNALDQEGINPESVLRVGLRCYLKMVFTDGLFHGDLHAGNMFVLPNNRIGLVDFGVVGRLNRKTQSAIANMLVALAGEDYDRLAYEYVDLAPYSGHVNADLFARDLRDLIAPYYGLTLKHVNVGKLLMDSTAIAANYHLQMPAELIMFFKSIMTIEGMGRVIVKDFNFLAYSLEFAAELVQSRTEPAKIMRDLSGVGRDINSLLATLPRQLKQLVRRISSPDFSFRLDLKQIDELRDSQNRAANTVFYGVIIAALILSGSLIQTFSQGHEWIFGLPAMAVLQYSTAILLLIVHFSRRR